MSRSPGTISAPGVRRTKADLAIPKEKTLFINTVTFPWVRMAPSSSHGISGSVRDKSWFLYLIECLDGSIYTGITVDVAARFAVHRAGKGARYTRSHPPRCLLASEAYPDRAAAARAEYRVKCLSAAGKRRYAELLRARSESGETA